MWRKFWNELELWKRISKEGLGKLFKANEDNLKSSFFSIIKIKQLLLLWKQGQAPSIVGGDWMPFIQNEKKWDIVRKHEGQELKQDNKKMLFTVVREK